MLSETFVVRHVNHLFGGDTAVITRNLLKQEAGEVKRPVFCYKMSGFEKNLYPLINYLLARPYNALLFSSQKKLESFLEQNAVEAVLVEFGPLSGIISTLAKKRGLPYFVYFRGNDASAALRSARKRRLYQLSIKDAAAVFAVSDFLLGNLKQAGIKLPASHVIPSGVDLGLFYPEKKTPYKMVFVGRFVEKKQPLLVIRAFAKIAQVYKQARFYMIGEGPLFDEAKSLVTELGLENQISLLGPLPHTEVAGHLKNAEVLIQCSVTDAQGATEGLPSIIQEAMACGVLVIGSRHAGTPEAIEDRVNGLLVEERSETALVDALHKAFSNPEEAVKIRTNAREKAVASFDQEKLLRKTEKIIRSSLIR